MRKTLILALTVTVLLGSTTVFAGRVLGPAYKTDIVGARCTDTYCEVFRANEEARIIVAGDGDTDLDLYVYDENGNLIESDADNTDFCVVRFTPRWTGPFTIRIVNRGSVSNVYRISMN